MLKIIYKCKKCSWKKSISAEWGDLQPKMCGNKRCAVSYFKNPDLLEVTKEQPPAISITVKEDKIVTKSKKDKKEDYERRD